MNGSLRFELVNNHSKHSLLTSNMIKRDIPIEVATSNRKIPNNERYSQIFSRVSFSTVIPLQYQFCFLSKLREKC